MGNDVRLRRERAKRRERRKETWRGEYSRTSAEAEEKRWGDILKAERERRAGHRQIQADYK